MLFNQAGRTPRASWTGLALLFCVPTLIPLLAVGHALLTPDTEIWAHLTAYVLPKALIDTLLLMLGVAVGVLVVGVGMAGLVAMTEFPGRGFFEWALLLPLAIPGYVMAVAFLGLFDYGGAATGLMLGLGIPVDAMRGRTGLVLVLTASLYPYVYLVVRDAFASAGIRSIEAARSLGHRPLSAFCRALLPLSLPWIAAGTSLALMETLADFGAVSAFNYDTLTVAIYKTWYAQFSPHGALQVAGVLLLFVLGVLVLEARSRRHMRFVSMGQVAPRMPLGRYRWVATASCTLLFAATFMLPTGWLLAQVLADQGPLVSDFVSLATNTLGLATMATIATTLVALLMTLATYFAPSRLTFAAQRISTLGYAFPGALLAVGLYVPIAGASAYLLPGGAIGLSSMGLLLLIVGYGVRFLAVGHAPIAAGMLRISPTMIESARLTGMGSLRIIRGIHLPLLRTSVLTAALLIFVDVMKEMPITLMMRPFGWDTFSTRIFEFSTEGEWRRAAAPSLALLVAGLVPVLLLYRGTRRERVREDA